MTLFLLYVILKTPLGGVSERFKEPVLKTGDSKEPWVRIPPPPPKREKLDTKCGEMAEPVEGGRLLSD